MLFENMKLKENLPRIAFETGNKVCFFNSNPHAINCTPIGIDSIIETVQKSRWESYPVLHQEIKTDVHPCWIDSSNYKEHLNLT